MGVRNSAELGVNLQKIVSRLLANDNLVKYLYYTDKDPLAHDNLTEQEKKEKILHNLIKIIPRVGPKETSHSILVLRIISATQNYSNAEFRDVQLSVELFTPLTQWTLKSDNLRPFLILGEVEKSLKGKTINGLGRIEGGGFDLNFLTEEISCYEQNWKIVAYD